MRASVSDPKELVEHSLSVSDTVFIVITKADQRYSFAYTAGDPEHFLVRLLVGCDVVSGIGDAMVIEEFFGILAWLACRRRKYTDVESLESLVFTLIHCFLPLVRCRNYRPKMRARVCS